MSIQKTKPWKRRVWLNPNRSYDDGYIITSVDTEGDFNLKIADCNRIVDLNVYYSTKSEKKRRIRKMNVLIDELTNLRDAMESIDV
jgi:hypothetical protein